MKIIDLLLITKVEELQGNRVFFSQSRLQLPLYPILNPPQLSLNFNGNNL